MITLPIDQRLAAHEYALKCIQSWGCDGGICYYLITWIDGNTGYRFVTDYHRQDFETMFPEFARHKPSMITWENIWWPREDRQSRIDLLKIIIKETKEKINGQN